MRGFAAWFLSAAILLLLGALLASALSMGERELAWLSSAISFFAAAAAGHAVSGGRGRGRLGAALITALAITILLLTVGCFIQGKDMDPSAILSLVSFTFSGCLVGAFLLSHTKRKRKTVNSFS